MQGCVKKWLSGSFALQINQ